MNSKFKKKIYVVFFILIAMLLCSDIFVTYLNHKTEAKIAKNPKKALKTSLNNLIIAKILPIKNITLSKTHSLTVVTYTSSMMYNDAFENCNIALELLQKSKSKDNLYRGKLYFYKAVILEKWGKKKEALVLYKKSAKLGYKK